MRIIIEDNCGRCGGRGYIECRGCNGRGYIEIETDIFGIPFKGGGITRRKPCTNPKCNDGLFPCRVCIRLISGLIFFN